MARLFWNGSSDTSFDTVANWENDDGTAASAAPVDTDEVHLTRVPTNALTGNPSSPPDLAKLVIGGAYNLAVGATGTPITVGAALVVIDMADDYAAGVFIKGDATDELDEIHVLEIGSGGTLEITAGTAGGIGDLIARRGTVTLMGTTKVQDLWIADDGDRDNDASVNWTTAVTVDHVHQTGGVLTAPAGTVTKHTISDGTATYSGDVTLTELEGAGGTVNWNGDNDATLTLATLSGATLDCTANTDSVDLTEVKLLPHGTLNRKTGLGNVRVTTLHPWGGIEIKDVA
jgi:hypothetical protein